jgi:hypothetical protein
MYRAQRIAEFALYDSDPLLVDSELDHYLNVTAAQIQQTTARYLDVPNRVVLDIVPVPAAAETEEPVKSASPQAPGDPHQPGSPAPQIPGAPASEPDSPVHSDVAQLKTEPSPEQPQDPADVKPPTESGPLHV